MRPFRISAGFSMVMLVTGIAVAQTVTTDYSKGTDFSKYKTFLWIKEPTAMNPLNTQRIVNDVNAVLKSKGLQLVPSEADIGIAAHAATEKEQTLHTFYDGFGGGWRWHDSFGSATTTLNTYTVGTLVIDIFDARTREAVWRGTAMKTLSDNPKKVAEAINKAIAKMFKSYPPTNTARSH